MIDSVCEIVRKMEDDYVNGTTTISKYVEYNQYELNNKIDAALNSKFIEGDKDAMGREKPYFNIVIAVRNIWYRATNIARNKIRIKATKVIQYVLAFVATILVQEWMKKENFEGFLDKWGISLANHGSSVPKFVEKDGRLHCAVIPWNRIICDQISFDNNVVIEVLEFTPAQLKKQGYDPEEVKALLDTASARETLDKQKKDNKADYIKVYEVHGELPLSLLTGNEADEETYVQQMHVVSFVGVKPTGRGNWKEEYEDFTLYKGKEEKSPYMITHLLEEDGRTQSIGAVETMLEPQWMTNHTAKQIKDTLDFASLVITQTADGSFVGKNVLTGLMTGDILVHSENNPLTQLNNQHDITQLISSNQMWQNLGKEMSSTPDAIRGNTQPSGTAFRTVAVENKEAGSLFEVMRRTKKRYLGEMIRKFIIPFIKKQMDTSEEIAATLEAQDINLLDSMYVPNEVIRRDNRQIIDTVLSGQIAQSADPMMLEQQIKNELSVFGNQRFLKPSDIPDKTWKKQLADLEWVTDIDETDKDSDDDKVAQTLVDLFKTAMNPAYQAVMQTPEGKFLFNKVLESTNAVSPLEIPHSTQMPSNGGPTSVQTMAQGMNNGNPQPVATQYQPNPANV